MTGPSPRRDPGPAGTWAAAPRRSVPLLPSRATIEELRARIDGDMPELVDRWVEIASIPAPSGHEETRGRLVERIFREMGLEEVRRDEIGNVIGVLRGRARGPVRVAYAAHLDTVAREGDPARVVRTRDGRLEGPGVRDDAAGLVGLIGAVRALKRLDLRPPDDAWIVATVQEEIGLLGARKFLDDHARSVGRFVAIDGDLGDVSYGATGIVWLKVHFTAPGGHTLKSAGLPSATLAAARAIEAIYELDVPVQPEARASWLNVGSIGGGDAINAMARDAWFTVDLRSNDPNLLARLRDEIRTLAARAGRRSGVETRIEVVLEMPGATLPGQAESGFVRLAVEALTAAGWASPRRILLGTADHNRAIERGIPGICVGVTTGTDLHTPQETASVAPLATGITALALLMASLPAAP